MIMKIAFSKREEGWSHDQPFFACMLRYSASKTYLGTLPQLEWWNTGKMEYWDLEYWDNGLLAKKFLITWSVNDKFLSKINIPAFHHSIIPCELQKYGLHKNTKILLFPTSCRVSETFGNYPRTGTTSIMTLSEKRALKSWNQEILGL